MRKLNVIDRDGLVEMVEDVLYCWLKSLAFMAKMVPWLIVLAAYVWLLMQVSL